MEKILRQIGGNLKKEIVIKGVTNLLLFGCICSTFWQFSIRDFAFSVWVLSQTLMIMIFCVSLFTCFLQEKSCFKLTLTDILLVSLAIYFVCRYDFNERLADWKIIIWIEIVIFWFLIKYLIINDVLNSNNVSWILVITGCVQSIWGMLQLYGYCPSNHHRFDITGSFLNPGPYSGYIGVIFPIALYLFLKNTWRKQWLALTALILILCILPAGMSRSAWIGALVSSLLVLFWQKQISRYWHYKKHIFIVCIIIGIIISLTCGMLLFFLKQDSVYGRLFIWENTIEAIAEKPIMGYGSCTFPVVYSAMQSKKFQSGEYAEVEERVAGNPECVFNEYLQMWLENGVVMLILLGGLLFVCLRNGIRQKQYGLCGGVISFLVFAFSSYPFQYPAFWIVLFLMLACLSIQGDEMIKRRYVVYLPFVLFVPALCLFLLQPSPTLLIDSWERCRILKAKVRIILRQKDMLHYFPK